MQYAQPYKIQSCKDHFKYRLTELVSEHTVGKVTPNKESFKTMGEGTAQKYKVLPPPVAPAVSITPTGREAVGGWWVALPVRKGVGYT